MLAQAVAALFLDPGLGKTSITAAVLKVLKRDGQMRGALVICPLRPARMVWPEEFTKWADFNGLSVGVLHGDKKQQVLEADHDVYVTNHDSIPWLFGREKRINPKTGKPNKHYTTFLTPAGKLLLSKVNILVLDELSKFKHTNTQRFKRLEPWLHKFDRRYGLTGSPAANGLMDLFGQCLVLDGGRALGPYITHYRERYFTSVGQSGFVFVLKHGAAEEIYERVRPLALSMEAKDYLTLPVLRPLPIKLDMPDAIRAVYTQLEDDFLTIIEDETLTAPNAASSKMMLRQICSGAVYKPQIDFVTGIKRTGKREWLLLHNDKLDALQELIDELQGQQLLIAYEFQHDLERLLERWPDLPYFGQSDKKDMALKNAWNRGEVPLAAGHPQSVAHGLNLQDSNAHNVAWFTLTWDFELFDQFNKRLLRQGNTASYLNCYMFVTKDTVEESVFMTLRAKAAGEAALKTALKKKVRIPKDLTL